MEDDDVAAANQAPQGGAHTPRESGGVARQFLFGWRHELADLFQCSSEIFMSLSSWGQLVPATCWLAPDQSAAWPVCVCV